MSKEEKYQKIIESLDDFLVSYLPKLDNVGLMATINSVVKSAFEQLVFVGFYVTRCVDGENILEIGPYQGHVLACARIEFGSGVCGTSAQKKETVIVPDVREFENYIACDCETLSEIVVPVIRNGEVTAVFDVDSRELGYFNELDRVFLERLVSYLN